MREENKIHAFVAKKIKLLESNSPWSRGMLAKLRRSVGKAPGSVPDIWEITLGETQEEWHRRDGAPSYAEIAIHTALTLYATHQQGKDSPMNVCGKDERGNDTGNSFGAAAGRLIRSDRSNEQSVKRRFDAAATATDFAELAHHARGLIQLLRTADIPINYPRFAHDLYQYQFQEGADAIRLRWGQDFYRIQDKNVTVNQK
ncbi:MAG TPA: type I-E CRISPR-associated protein Cse2/CasB [Syntrophorhabdaceae bacterium]|nr:type I-E CRISPR-associated protein Cse2/CasB [Syntrophorhabdaceae bacterium]